jgi:hypothetical protein
MLGKQQAVALANWTKAGACTIGAGYWSRMLHYL